MSNDYTKDVLRFGSIKPFVDEDGRKFNLSHNDNIDPNSLVTDRLGNVLFISLIRRKPCFGRPERFVRGHSLGAAWLDDQKNEHFNQSRCDGCLGRSRGTYDACSSLINERVDTAPPIKAALDVWFEASDGLTGERCFTQMNAKPWQKFLRSIIDHGGWTNVNDDAVKLHAIQAEKNEKTKRNHAQRAVRAKKRAARQGAAIPNTTEYLDELRLERDRRAVHLKKLGQSSAAPRWLAKLTDEGCERMADVWQARETITRLQGKCTGTAIASYLALSRSCNVASLTTRVYEDLKRIAKLESNSAASPVWAPWLPGLLGNPTP